jgi:hypothetical protein
VDGSGRVASSASIILAGNFIVGTLFLGTESLFVHGDAEFINDIIIYLLKNWIDNKYP